MTTVLKTGNTTPAIGVNASASRQPIPWHVAAGAFQELSLLLKPRILTHFFRRAVDLLTGSAATVQQIYLRQPVRPLKNITLTATATTFIAKLILVRP